MKIAELGKNVAKAELFLWKKRTGRVGKQIVLYVLAALFGLFTLISLHVLLAVLFWSLLHTGIIVTSALICGCDVLLAIIFFVCACSCKAGRQEIEAQVVRDHNLTELRNNLAVTALISTFSGPIGLYIGRSFLKIIKGFFRKG